jgi:single-strand DNA-binding protein
MAIGETTITIVGNLTADPELRFTPAGAAVVAFSIASTPRAFDKTKNEWKDGDTLFLRASAWRDLAEHVAESLTKGQRVVATGRLKQRSYEDREGVKRTVVELDVDEIGPSLKYATAKVTKATRNNGAPHPADTTAGAGGSGWGGGFGGGAGASDPWQSGAPLGASTGDQPPF